MPDERRQFLILFRHSLLRIVDTELLSAGGDVGKLLGQVAAILAAFSFTFLVVTLPKYLSTGEAQTNLLLAARAEAEFLFATTMGVAGLFAVLVWNAVLPDRRDCAVLGVLPVRLRTVFLARVAAIAAALGVVIVAINIFTGLCYPFLALPQGGGAWLMLRSLAAYWLTMTAAGLFVCGTLLTVQGLAAVVLSHRMFLRVSSWIQLAAFFVILGSYFLKPPIPSDLNLANLQILSWVPSFWYYALFQQLNGAAPPILAPIAGRALWAVAFSGTAAVVTFTFAFHRHARLIVEQPDIAAGSRSGTAARLGRFLANHVFLRPLDRAIFLFTARTVARSRQHRLLLAAYGGIALAITLVYAKDLIYGYSGGLWDSLGVNGAVSAHWNQANVPFLAGSLILLTFAVIGARATFSMPIQLPANWIFHITAVHSPAAYFAAVRKALFVLTAIPMWIAAAILCFAIWPALQALQHVTILILTGIILVEISLYRFRKIPFACSYLPGKANMNIRLGAYALLFMFAADRGVAIEYWAMQNVVRFIVLCGILLAAAVWAGRRTLAFANHRDNRIQFEDVAPDEVFALDLRQDGAWSSDEAYVNAIDPHFGRKLAEWAAGTGQRAKAPLISLNLGAEPLPAVPHAPAIPFRNKLEHLQRDIQWGARVIRKSPGFSAATIVLIALGIGGNVTIYSIIHSILAKPAPGVRANSLVTFGASIDGQVAEGGPLNSYPNYLDLASQTKTMSALTASAAAPWFTLTLPDGAYQVRGEMVTENYFETLGVPLVKGRTFTAEEARGSSGLPAVIAYHVWQIQFHGMENIVGQAVIVNGHPATVIGVTAKGFYGTGLAPRFEIGLPLTSRISGVQPQLVSRASRGVTIFGRLEPNAGLLEARKEFAAISRSLQAAYPGENRGWAVVLAPYSATAFGPNSGPQARRLMGGVSLIALLALLVVCGNVASLMLGRSLAREREIAIRLSMGASRPSIIRLLVIEGLTLSLTACFAAWLLASWITRTIGKFVPPLESGVQLQLDLTPDAQVLAYSMALAALSTLAFTLVPAIRFWRHQIQPLLKVGEHAATPGRSRIASVLVITQLALCVVLVTAGSLAYQSLFFIDTSDLYFTRDHLLLAGVNTSGAAATREENVALLERIRQRVSAVPGVTSASYATAAPPHDHGWMDLPVEAVDSNRSVLTDGTITGPEYIAALGVPGLLGRDISAQDVVGRHPTAVINQKLAAALWPGQSGLGRTILLNKGSQPIEIIGIVPNGAFSGVAKDGSFGGIGKAERPNFLFLSEQGMSGPGAKTLHIRHTSQLPQIIRGVRAAVREVDGRVPVFSLRTMDAEFTTFTAPIRIVTTLIGLFAISAMVLSTVGLYAVIAFNTTTRTREFGIRSALGATSWQVLSAVLKQCLMLTGVGVAIGLMLTATFARTADNLLFGVNPTDKVTYVAVSGLLTAVSLLACYIPARRASRVPPMSVLRQD